MKFHPLADLFPMMSDEEFKALVQDIGEHGQVEPIIIYENKILDGRNQEQMEKDKANEKKVE